MKKTGVNFDPPLKQEERQGRAKSSNGSQSPSAVPGAMSSTPVVKMHTPSVPGTKFRQLFPIVATALIVVIGISGYVTVRSVVGNREWVMHTYQVKEQIQALQANRILLLSNRADAGSPHSDLLDLQYAQAMRTSLARLAKLTVDATQQQRVKELEPLLNRELAQFSKDANAAQPVAALANGPSEIVLDREFTRILSEVDQDESQVLISRQAAWEKAYQRNTAVLALAIAACLLLLVTNVQALRADVAASQKSEVQSRESAESYRMLSGKVIGLQDIERRKIARELHDSVGQYLAALQMNVDRMTTDPSLPAENPAFLGETRELLQGSIREVRTISQLLHPPLLGVAAFGEAVRTYAEEFAKRSGIKAEVDIPEDLEVSSKDAELSLFRILQESLTNVHRHSGAKTVVIRLESVPNKIVMTVKDDGKGLPARVAERLKAGIASGVGLGGMRERIAEFGGSLEVESAPGGGTRVRTILPV